MADHVAKQLRDAVMAALANLPTIGTNVFRERPGVRSLQDTEVPALLVYQSNEDVAFQGVSGSLQQRIQSLRVSVRVKGSGADDTLDQIRKEVEIALASPVTISGILIYLKFSGMSEPEEDGSQEKLVIGADLNYSAEMYTNAEAPDILV